MHAEITRGSLNPGDGGVTECSDTDVWLEQHKALEVWYSLCRGDYKLQYVLVVFIYRVPKTEVSFMLPSVAMQGVG